MTGSTGTERESAEPRVEVLREASVAAETGRAALLAPSQLAPSTLADLPLSDRLAGRRVYRPEYPLRADSPWSLTLLGGASYVFARGAEGMRGRHDVQSLERVELSLRATRLIGSRWWAGISVDGSRHGERLSFARETSSRETVYHPEAYRVNGEAVGDSVSALVLTRRRVVHHNATSAVDAGLTLGRLIVTPGCDYEVFAGVQVRLARTFSGKIRAGADGEPVAPEGDPWTGYAPLRYVAGTRGSLPLGEHLRLTLEARAQLGGWTAYGDADGGEVRSREAAFGLRGGLTWRF